ncbi:MAG: hypothetical protein NVS9B3_13870 [Gemmatimonadaceae bacterium]
MTMSQEVRVRPDYRFFEEYTDHARGQSAGNVIAVHFAAGSYIKDGAVVMKAVCAPPEKSTPNSPVVMTFFNAEYLGARCRRVTEDAARMIHPRLFEYLETLA